VPGAVRHPGIAELYDRRSTDDGVEFWIIEPLAGESVAARIARSGRLMPAESIEIAAALALALGALHSRGLVHGALRASSVVLCPTESGGREVKLVALSSIGQGDPQNDVVALARLVGQMLSGEEPDHDDAGSIRGSRPSFSRRTRIRTSLPELDGVIARAIDGIDGGCPSVTELSSRLWWALAQAKATGRLSRDGVVPLPEPRVRRSIAMGVAIGLILLAAGISVAEGFSHRTDPAPTQREASG
jgi:serine/threonine protein kinase